VKLRLDGGLPFIAIQVGWEQSSLTLYAVLIDLHKLEVSCSEPSHNIDAHG